MVRYSKLIITVLIIIIALSGCSKSDIDATEISLVPEDIITYIIQDYKFGESDFILKYVNNEYVTNELIIDMLADNFTICNDIEKLSDNQYLVEVDNGRKLAIMIIIDSDKIQKIRVQDYIE